MTEEEVKQEEPAAAVPEAQEKQEEQVEPVAEQVVEESASDRNWKAAQEALRQQKAEIEALRVELQKKAAPVVEPEKDEFADLDPEDYITVAKMQRVVEKRAQAAASQAVEKYAREQNVNLDEARCKAKYDDFDYVLQNFAFPQIKNDPALAHKIANSKNPAEAAYKLGKLHDDYVEAPLAAPKKDQSKKVEKIIKNASRPTSINAVSNSSTAPGESKMTKEDYWNQSQEYAKRAY